MIKIESFGIIPLKKDQESWKVLLILHKEGSHWGFPKGKADGQETAKQSAVRELKEETGLDVSKLLLEEPLIEHYQFRNRQDVIVKTVHYFPAIVEGSLQLQPEEIRDSKWVDLKFASQHLTFKEAKNICQQVIELMAKLES